MKKRILLSFLVLINLIAFAQDFAGYNSGNYQGVNGVFVNPANAVDSRYNWDFNLIGVHAGLGNNNAEFKLGNLGDVFSSHIDSLLLGSSAKNTNAIANVDIFGPSVLFNAGRTTSVAITTRVRTLANLLDIDGKLINSVNSNLTGTLPLTLNSKANQKIVANAWADFGLTLGQILLNENHHFLKVGVTGKYLAGVANTHTTISNFKGTANSNALGTYITDANGAVSIGISGVNLDNFKASDLTKFKSSGFGADLGFVYEYRPYGDANTIQFPNKYKYKLAVSLLDMGKISYTPDATKTGSYSITIPSTQKWYPQALQDSSLTGIKNYLNNNGNPSGSAPYFTNTGSSTAAYKASLPTNLIASFDYNIHRGLFIGLATQLNTAAKNDKYTSYYNNSVTLTPRYEGRALGVYVPLNYNELTKFNAGVAFRLGPLFVGSGSVLTALFGKSKQADFHIGLHLGSLKPSNFVSIKKSIIEETIFKHKKPVKHKATKSYDQKNGYNTNTSTSATSNSSTSTNTTTNTTNNVNTITKTIYDTVKVIQQVITPVVEPKPVIKDTDGDGVIDSEDKCPSVVGVKRYNGCPVPDSDGDGINDEDDKCVTVPGVPKYHGCPVPDSDGDGVNDDLDECPTVIGSAKYHGCPIPDTDGDGINDEEDKCPGLAGDKANSGCPPVKKASAVVAPVAPESTVQKDIIKKVNIAAKGLRFATGKAVILKTSYLQLDNVVKILKADPALNLAIQGYTDNVGNADKNKQLSSDRAKAAKAYFVKKGIAESRLTSAGFGADNPIASNKTPAGRMKNRRVVFAISK